MKVVICGGGIIGSSIAYHLAKKGVTATVIERCHPACAASGKAGGFLAKNWCDSFEVGPMANASFAMHMSLSEDENFKDCDYRRMDTLGLNVQEGGTKRVSGLPEWMDGGITRSSTMGSTQTTAQVHPRKLTEAFLSTAKKLAGTKVLSGTVENVEKDNQGKVTGVHVKDHGTMPADIVVITLGPWSAQAKEWLGFAPVQNCRAHSIVLKPRTPTTPHAVFMEYGSRSPEVYPRPDDTVYVCGMSDNQELPVNPLDIHPNLDSCKTLKCMSGELSTTLKEAEVVTEQACHLPSSPDGLPIIGAIPNVQGAYMATAHSCWGILNAPATGEAMAQLIINGKCELFDLEPFNPARLL